MCVCVCVWLCGVVVVSLAQGGAEFKPHRQFFHLIFHLPPTNPTSPPTVIGDLAFARVQIQGLFSWNSINPGGTSGAHTTCCEERPVLLRVHAWLQELCLQGSECLLSAQVSWLCQVRVTI